MARLKTIALGLFNSVRYVLSDRYRQGFNYCDRCYRSALISMRDSMDEEMNKIAERRLESNRYYDAGLFEGYSRCLRKLRVILDHIGEYHER